MKLTKSFRDLIVRTLARAPEVEIKSCPVYSAHSMRVRLIQNLPCNVMTKDKMEYICAIQ